MARETPIRIDRELLRRRPLPDSDGDKSERGTVLVVGGARQTPGAVLLAAETALRVGAGKVQVATAQDTAAAVGVALPEAFVEALPVLRNGELAVAGADRVIELAGAADVVLVGPGMGDPQCADLFLAQVVPRLEGSVVLDALGTAYLTSHPDGVRHLPGRVLLTPNVTEVAAMLGRAEEDVEQDLLDAAREVAGRTGAVVLSGSDVTYVVTPDGDSWCSDAGPTSLATAGSGDVKAGAVAGLMGRGASPDQAALWGAWIHARAGEHLVRERSGFVARDVVEAIPNALSRAEGDRPGPT